MPFRNVIIFVFWFFTNTDLDFKEKSCASVYV